MIIEEFERLSDFHKGELYVNEEKVDVGGGARDFFYILKLHIPYKGKTIKIKNTTGAPVGMVTCDFGEIRDSLAFEMVTRDIFISLFLRGHRFKFKHSSPNIDRFFKSSPSIKDLKRITKETAFEPTIIGTNENKTYQLKFHYSLKFENWHLVINPIINFYKDFIDEFDS